MLKAILFDMDGTLIDTEQILYRFHRERAEEAGLTFTRPFYASLMGQDQAVIRQMCDTEFHGAYNWKERCEEAMSMVSRIAAEGKMPLRPGVACSLPRLKAAGLKLGIVTSTERSIVSGYLEHIPALRNMFDAAVCGTEAPRRKPAPDPFLMCAEKLGVSPGECMGVEDGAAGLISIRSAGMISVFIPDMLVMSDSLKPYVSYLLESMNDLPGLADSLRKS